MRKRKWEFKFDVLKPWRRWKNRKKPKKIEEYEWVYECGCPADRANDSPYCDIHGLALIYRKKEIV